MADAAAGAPRATLLAAALLCALTVPGCAGSPQPSVPPASATTTTTAAPHASANGAGQDHGGTATANGGLNATDIGWIQLMIAMDDQAHHILRLARGRTADKGLLDWADDTADGHRAELGTLRALLAKAGIPDDNPHAGHEMPGMVSTRELRALETARGSRFDRLLRSALGEHLKQKRMLATSVRKADADPEVKRVALSVGTSASDAQRRMPSAPGG
ncbi:hypothetical protein AQJ11_34335 [Streptomyces corchorusii]|uniref:DUF305 domain-containing protein n=2 Tax=Streptomyces TaxID=1883 RepID=A0A124HK55_STRCK|nr:DUF305 domain-containing protein [Streptomyces corchorusii]KUN18522.1 hypothetical protein AQJ11_34335 [Streptomyces corchorusii]